MMKKALNSWKDPFPWIATIFIGFLMVYKHAAPEEVLVWLPILAGVWYKSQKG